MACVSSTKSGVAATEAVGVVGCVCVLRGGARAAGRGGVHWVAGPCAWHSSSYMRAICKY
jgi:hypothetical protein